MNPTVSIIVPIYNTEHTLHRCLDSILTQEYTDFELILVDDGSSDGSPALCDACAAKNERVKVIHQENAGVSAARNRAVEMSAGTYLQFVDSDDWLTPKATALMVSAAQKNDCDMVITDFYRVSGSRVSHKGNIDEEGLMNREEFAGHMMEKPADFYYGVLWNKLFRRSIIEAHQLRMNPEISWCEDFLFNLEYILHASSFYVLPIPVYYYLKRKGSLASQGINIRKTVQMKLTVFEYYNNFYKNVWSEEDYEKHRFQIHRFLIDAAGDGVVLPAILPGTKKLGEEQGIISCEALEGEGELLNAYRDRKLLDYYLETAAQKYNLTMPEVRLLTHIDLIRSEITREELADFAGLTTQRLSSLLQQLARKGYLRVDRPEKPEKPDRREKKEKEERKDKKDKTEKPKEPKLIIITLLPAAEHVLSGIREAQDYYNQAKFAGFTEEDFIRYEQLQKKIEQNIQRILPAGRA